jgi:hypothetical protein
MYEYNCTNAIASLLTLKNLPHLLAFLVEQGIVAREFKLKSGFHSTRIYVKGSGGDFPPLYHVPIMNEMKWNEHGLG